MSILQQLQSHVFILILKWLDFLTNLREEIILVDQKLQPLVNLIIIELVLGQILRAVQVVDGIPPVVDVDPLISLFKNEN